MEQPHASNGAREDVGVRTQEVGGEMTSVEDQLGYEPNQHCTYPDQDGENDYSFIHTAKYCGRPQPRRCGCGACYGDDDEVAIVQIPEGDWLAIQELVVRAGEDKLLDNVEYTIGTVPN